MFILLLWLKNLRRFLKLLNLKLIIESELLSIGRATLNHINQYNTDKQNLEKKWRCCEKITDTRALVTTTVLKTNISKIQSKIPDVSGLVTTTVLNTKISEVENKIPDNSKCNTHQEFNELTAEKLAARLKQADLVNKINFDNKLTNSDKQITSNKTKHVEVQKKLNSLIKKIIFFS